MDILKEWRPVTHPLQLFIRILLINFFPRNFRVPVIDVFEPVFKYHTRDHARCCKCERRSESGRVFGFLSLKVNERPYYTAQVASTGHKRNAHTLLPCSGKVVGRPGIVPWDNWVDTNAREDDCKIAGSDVVLDFFSECKKDGKCDYSQSLAGDNDRHTPAKYGGILSNCAFAELYPIFLTIWGRENFKP